MTEHMFVLGHIGPGPTFWSPWQCICGAGGTGADDAAAENQYDLHIAGFWPAFIEAIPESRPIKWKGRTLWVKRP
jgi:hypothetical protein